MALESDSVICDLIDLAHGKDLKTALLSCEIVEKASMVTVYASLLGKVNTVPSYALKVEREWFEKLKGE